MVRAGLAGDASLGLIVAAVAVTSQLTGQVQTLLTLTFWTLESLRATRAFLDVVADGTAERAAAGPATPVTVPARLERGITLEGLSFGTGTAISRPGRRQPRPPGWRRGGPGRRERRGKVDVRQDAHRSRPAERGAHPGGRDRSRAVRAPLLRILDEPSASLDARAEEWLFRQYAGLSRLEGGVTVLVTHRIHHRPGR